MPARTPRTLKAIADLIGGTILAGDETLAIENLAGLEDAGAGDLSFYDSVKYRKAALATTAAALLVREKLESFKGAQIQSAMPYLAFMQLVPEFYPEKRPTIGVHPSAVIAPGALVAQSASIGANVTVEDGATIGERVILMAGAYVGRDARIADDCLIYPNVAILERSRLGERVIVHAGAVIGDDGFGYRRDETGHRKIPHVGYVEIGSDVEIGSNTTIDRGTFGRTIIGAGTKIDNLVQIAHNVRIGERTLIIAQAGLAGGSRIGSDSIIAGQAGIADHAVVGDATIIIPQSAVPKRAKSGGVFGGSPIMPYRDLLKVSSALRFLPALLARVRAIEEKLGLKSAAPPAADED